jgi:hypothetical protein
MIRNKNRKTRIAEFPILLLILITLLVVPSTQLIPKLEVYATDPNQIVKILSEGGQICPLESECAKKENQTDAHNMTLNIPGAGIPNNEQDSMGNSTTNNSNSSQNKTNTANGTSITGETNNSVDMVDIKTDKQTYNPGEIVSIMITNRGSAELTFPNSALGLTIRNLASNELYPILSSQVITILGPGDSKSLRWDQIGVNGNPAASGNYSASVSSDITTAQTTFSIR